MVSVITTHTQPASPLDGSCRHLPGLAISSTLPGYVGAGETLHVSLPEALPSTRDHLWDPVAHPLYPVHRSRRRRLRVGVRYGAFLRSRWALRPASSSLSSSVRARYRVLGKGRGAGQRGRPCPKQLEAAYHGGTTPTMEVLPLRWRHHPYHGGATPTMEVLPLPWRCYPYHAQARETGTLPFWCPSIPKGYKIAFCPEPVPSQYGERLPSSGSVPMQQYWMGLVPNTGHAEPGRPLRDRAFFFA